MRIEKKWTVKNVPNVLSDNQMKHVIAGYSDGYGDSGAKAKWCCLDGDCVLDGCKKDSDCDIYGPDYKCCDG